MVENTYFPVDCTHGAGGYTDGIFERNFSHLYFFTPPERLILTHWVEDELFQLLEDPVSLHDLEQLVAPNLELYSHGIFPETLCQFIDLTSSSPVAKIDLTFHSSSLNSFESVVLTSLNQLMDHSETPLHALLKNDNSLTFVRLSESKVSVYVMLPTRGRFSLDIHLAKKGTTSGKKTKCLSYVLAMEDEMEDSEFTGYPKIYENSAANCDFAIESFDNYMCKVDDKLEMRLRSKQNTKLKHCICPGKVTKPAGNMLKCYSHISTEKGNPSVHNFTAIFPTKGWWTIFIFNETDDTRYFMMQYQVYATCECKNTIYPYISDEAKKFCISLEQENLPVCYDVPVTRFGLICDYGYELVMTALLKRLQRHGESETDIEHKNNNSLTYIQQTGRQVEVHVVVPMAGDFSLDVYAAERGDSQQVLCVSYLLTMEHEVEDSEFMGYPTLYEKSAADCGFTVLIGDDPFGHTCKVGEKLEMIVKAKQNAKLHHYVCKGKVSEPTSCKFRSYTHVSTDENNPNHHHFIAVFPHQGWWTIFILNKTAETNYFLMEYQVYATSECENHLLYPYVTDVAGDLSICLQDKDMPVNYANSTLPFAMKFMALYGLHYRAELTEINESGKEYQSESSAPCYTYVSPPHKRESIGCVYAIVPPGSWSLDVFANQPHKKTLLHVFSISPLHGSDHMKGKVFPKTTSEFSSMTLSPPKNVEEWMLPTVVNELEYPKHITIPFTQSSGEIQLLYTVECNNNQLREPQSVAKLQKLFENDHTIHRALDIVLSEKGERKFTLKGRKLHEMNSVYVLLEYTVIAGGPVLPAASNEPRSS